MTIPTPGKAAPSFFLEMAPTLRDLAAWSVFRFPFEPRGDDALTFRNKLAAELGRMNEGQLLQARYTSPSRELVDLENVLTYNVGRLGVFERLATQRLILERVVAQVPDCSARLASLPMHHAQYLVPPDGLEVGLAWEWGDPLISWERMAVPTQHCSKAWWAFRRSRIERRARRVHAGVFGVRIQVPRSALAGRLVSGMKTLVDGVISGCSHHIGSLDPIVLAGLVGDLGEPADLVIAELTNERTAVLGGRRLIGLRAGRPHWNPLDDPVVFIDLSRRTDGEPWISGELREVLPRARQETQPQ